MIDESGPEEISDLFSDFLSEALNSLSSRSASFIIPVKKEGSTDPFLRLLDFSGRSAEIS
jgi:hypothetical protein